MGTASGLAAVLIWSFTAPIVAAAAGVDPFLYIALGDGIGAFVFVAKWVALRHNPLPERFLIVHRVAMHDLSLRFREIDGACHGDRLFRRRQADGDLRLRWIRKVLVHR